MVRVDWSYRADGGSDAFVCSRHVAIVKQDGDGFAVPWLGGGSVQRFSCGRYARESVYAAAEDAPWDELGKPEV